MLNSQAPCTTNTQIYRIDMVGPTNAILEAFDEFILVFPPQITVKSHDLTEKKGSVVMRSLDFAYSSNLLTFVYTFQPFQTQTCLSTLIRKQLDIPCRETQSWPYMTIFP